MAKTEKKLYLGIELGSTRIKAVLISGDYTPIAIGSHNWENRLENGVWTYSIQDIWQGLQASYKAMAADYESKHDTKLTNLSGIGISAMMHGYLPLDSSLNPLTEFRTWRNTSTGEAAAALTSLFGFNIPLRWCIAHLYQAILNGESHIPQISTITTLAGYVHLMLTGHNVLGVGDASGAFQINSTTGDYHAGDMAAFDNLIAKKSYPWKLADIMPKVLPAGAAAGHLTPEGAKLLDPSGNLAPGIPLCPPEGDAGTGMVATNSVASGTGNVSAGTSIFAMIVLNKSFSKLHHEIDMVTTPDGKPVAMVHCNNGTSDLSAWVELFHNAHNIIAGKASDISTVYENLYRAALEGDADCGGLMAVNYLSGEHNTGFEEGRPLFMRLADANFTVPNFIRTMLFSSMATLKLGMDILTEEEGVKITQLMGHGGLFTTKGVAQKLMAGALDVPVSVMETASEGGAWGIALLAAYMAHTDMTLDKFLDSCVFANNAGSTLQPEITDTQGFNVFMKRFTAALKVERAAVDNFK
ncbi:MAG: FGGY-family carbohydrate kinase [Defluviitaleaceae bacterium]|nr:FGGY-family carbohydrate kinase [Defluviitaleaceae bacterium]